MDRVPADRTGDHAREHGDGESIGDPLLLGRERITSMERRRHFEKQALKISMSKCLVIGEDMNGAIKKNADSSEAILLAVVAADKEMRLRGAIMAASGWSGVLPSRGGYETGFGRQTRTSRPSRGIRCSRRWVRRGLRGQGVHGQTLGPLRIVPKRYVLDGRH